MILSCSVKKQIHTVSIDVANGFNFLFICIYQSMFILDTYENARELTIADKCYFPRLST